MWGQGIAARAQMWCQGVVLCRRQRQRHAVWRPAVCAIDRTPFFEGGACAGALARNTTVQNRRGR
eukprot:gene21553-biopygen14700